MKVKFWFALLGVILLAGCNGENKALLKNEKLLGKTYVFYPEFEQDSCDFVHFENTAPTWIHFHSGDKFLQYSPGGGYYQCHYGTFEYSDSLILFYSEGVHIEYSTSEKDGPPKKLIDKQTFEKDEKTLSFALKKCESKNYFVESVVAKYGPSMHSIKHIMIYGLPAPEMSRKDLEELINDPGNQDTLL